MLSKIGLRKRKREGEEGRFGRGERGGGGEGGGGRGKEKERAEKERRRIGWVSVLMTLFGQFCRKATSFFRFEWVFSPFPCKISRGFVGEKDRRMGKIYIFYSDRKENFRNNIIKDRLYLFNILI